MTSVGTPGSEADNDNAKGVRRTATGILAALLVVFVVTSLPENPSVWVLLVHAMAEAGMIGGLADWFAVEALFRRPLGLPIPHTALLPTNQKRAARNIARFIDEHFLDPDQLTREIRQFDPVGKAGVWLARRENAEIVAKEVSWAIRALVHAQSEHGIPEPVKALITDSLGRAAGRGHLPDHIAELIQESLETEFLDEVLAHVRNAIDENRPAISKLVQERSRWWIASGVDRQVAELLVDGVLSVLDDLADPASQRRTGFAASVHTIIDRFREDGAIARLIDHSMSDYADSSAFARALDDMLEASLHEIDKQLAENEESVQGGVTQALRQMGVALSRDRGVHDMITARFETALVPVLNSMRAPVREYILQTITRWDSTELVNRIESEVGRDLQFIRINGAVLGAVLGGILFVSSHFLF